jgi:hypothetical protein
MVEDGPIDVLTGDYLAELTMAILLRQQMRDPEAGYASTFLQQMEDVLATCVDRGIRVVANAGGLNPAGLATAIDSLAARLGIDITVAALTGDDLMPRLESLESELTHLDTGASLDEAGLRLVTANAYLGGWGIAAALGAGADVVVTGRVSDASLVAGPAAWHFGWERDDWDRLAGAVVAGHVIECGAQATGGNYSFFAEVPDLTHPGFPIAEVYADGSSVITKHPGTGGTVSVGTVTAQLLYEIGPAAYLNPDVVAWFDTIRLSDAGEDRVRIDGVRGTPPPSTTKVSGAALAGYRNSMTVVLSGLDIDAKSEAVLAALWDRTGGADQYDAVDVRLIRTDHAQPQALEQAMAYLKITVDHRDPERVGRAFSNAVVELALANVPGFTVTSPPGRETPLVRYWPSLVPQGDVVVAVGGVQEVVPATGPFEDAPSPPTDRSRLDGAPEATAPPADSLVVQAPIGRLVGARSGDKGGNANLGVWARSPEAYAWLREFLTVDRLTELLPDTAGLAIDRIVLPNLRAINFVIPGYLDEGVASSTRWDPQAKTLGEYFRAQVVDVPEALLAV